MTTSNATEDVFFVDREKLVKAARGSGNFSGFFQDHRKKWLDDARKVIDKQKKEDFLSQLTRKTSANGILELAQTLTDLGIANPLLYADSLRGFATRKTYLEGLFSRI
jgi:hypothetical protein